MKQINNLLKLACFSLALFSVQSIQAQCTSWLNPDPVSGWDDLGAAPCDDGSGCQITEITTFEVFAAEAYQLTSVVAGNSYLFGACNSNAGPNTGGQNWNLDFTIIAPSGAIDAFGVDGDNCSIAWTASESGTYLLVVNEAGQCGGGPNVMNPNGFPFITCTGAAPCEAPVTDCSAGELQTTGDTITVCAGGSFDAISLNDTIPNAPTQGGYGWVFDDQLGGTGGVVGGLTLTNSNPNSSFDNDLNGVLSFNNLPPLEGVWVIFGVAYEDNSSSPAAAASICSVTTDSIIVNFVSDNAAPTVSITNNGDGTATATPMGGTPPYTYSWSNGDTNPTAINLIEGESYTVVVTDANGCNALATLTITGDGTPCESWLRPTTSTGWTDFNTQFGGAPCDPGTGCVTNEITAFEVFASEAYAMDNIVLGGSYTFSMCNGTGAGTWVPDFTIIAPSGTIDAFGLGDGDGCSISWTASEGGTYLIVINEAGQCGGGNNTMTANGFPAITCDGVACPEFNCAASILLDNSFTVVCPGEGFQLSTIGQDTIPDGGSWGWSFSNQLGGTGGPSGPFTITNSQTSVNWDSGLDGILANNNLPDLGGTWVVQGFVEDPLGNTCAVSADSIIIDFSDVSIDIISDNGNGSASALASSSATPITYLWNDPAGTTTMTVTPPFSGIWVLTVTDGLGCQAIDSVDVIVTSIEDVEELQYFEVMPNPSSGLFNVDLRLGSSQEIRIDLMSVTGQQIQNIAQEESLGNNYRVDISHLPSGIYFLHFRVGAEQFVEKILLSN
ncbi:MAG: T9SS type A sorting domain-containing protein [Bacteroidota bacterium]